MAGLALGFALRREGIPVRVYEAGIYPRHRLCGEFISGAGPAEFVRLGLTDVLNESEVLTDAVWFRGDRVLLRRPLPEPARGISRWRLDAAMAARLTETGGEVICEKRVSSCSRKDGCWRRAVPGRKPGRGWRKKHTIKIYRWRPGWKCIWAAAVIPASRGWKTARPMCARFFPLLLAGCRPPRHPAGQTAGQTDCQPSRPGWRLPGLWRSSCCGVSRDL